MKKNLLVTLLAGVMSVTGFAQSTDFTVASLNVDGMPNKVSVLGVTVTLNPDAQESAGATNIGNGIARQGWDFIALSEDFNFHEDLMKPISNYYNSGTHRGTIPANPSLSVLSNPIDTDGLGLLWTKGISASNEAWWMWNKRNGTTSNGSDELIRKGYRYYTVTMSPGVELDVYIHHMDAETDPADNEAREIQITQLVDHILGTSNGRPILIMGDSNCRWTRDNLKGLLFDRINADERFDIHDPWVEFMWAEEGGYDAPQLQLGAESIMTHTFGAQKGEVVDKIFYINNTESQVKLTANWYRSETTFTFEGVEGGTPLSDHFPVVVNFTATGVNPVEPSTEVYLYNVATGQYLNQGGAWGTQAVLAPYGNRITLEDAEDGENSKYLHTTAGYMIPGFYLDGAADAKGTFNLERKDNGKYTISIDGQYLCAPNEGAVVATTGDATAAEAEWQLLSFDDLTASLTNATEAAPMDATFFIKGANFNRNDSDNDAWTKSTKTYSRVDIDGINEGDATSSNFVLRGYNSARTGTFANSNNTEWDVSYLGTGLPGGKYKISFQAVRDNLSDHYFTINGESVAGDIQGPLSSGTTGCADVAKMFQNGAYTIEKELDITGGTIDIKFGSPKHKSATAMIVDNFRLTYYGPTEAMLAARDRAKEAIEDAAAKAGTLDERGRSAYNNRLIEQTVAQDRVSGTGEDEVKRTYEALAVAAKAQNTPGADMTYAIPNWSFEMGWMNVDRSHPYWASMWAGATWVVANAPADDENHVEGADGDYLFTTSNPSTEEDADLNVNGPVAQDVTGLTNGLYHLSASVASAEGNTLYVFGNGVLSDGVAASGINTLTPVKVEADVYVRNGVLTLGATAATEGNEPVIPVESADEVWGGANKDGVAFNAPAFKADNFSLTFVCTLSFEEVQKAIDDATAKAQSAGIELDLAEYQDMVDSRAVTSDGIKEIIAIYDLLAEQTKARTAKESDMTYAILNNSFEMAAFGMPLHGWDYIPSSDTGVYPNTNETYTVASCDGEYLFNTWWQGTPLTQTITGLPCGTYRLTVQASSGDEGSETPPYVFLIANGMHSDAFELPNDKSAVTELTWEFELQYGEDLTLGIVGGTAEGEFTADGHWWYKADNFRLTLVEPLTVVEWTMGHDNYDTIILPFTVEAPEGMTLHHVYNIAETHEDDNNVGYYFLLTFPEESNIIKAHTPYFVMRENAAKSRSLEATGDNSYRFVAYKEENTGDLTNRLLVGTHEDMEVPEGGHVLTLSDNGYPAYTPAAGDVLPAAHAMVMLDFPLTSHIPLIYVLEEHAKEETGQLGISAALSEADAYIEVFNAAGVKVAAGTAGNVLPALERGVYVVKGASSTAKIAVK